MIVNSPELLPPTPFIITTDLVPSYYT